MIKFRLLSIFIVIFLLVMCGKNNSDVVSMEEFQSKILDENTFVLDVRTEAEFYGPLGHIEGATLIPIDELSSRMNELNKVKDKDIYVVCRSGNRSNVGKNILRENNFHAINVDGGMLAWKPLDNE
ncbi:MAG: rhodanese-like domain-containing protein [Candidatus Marinimicrobia bacterium]|mgnify:CR=1 FL=1|nr:rhodanese-like domain-containing protein [Gammaproteobacteria bacterium]MBL6911671.1 rhodanese-like domain-containing protein [Candidatus Neomarinimicrobiota bacterium]MBT3728170.1 rhodanese-like domain-containing protein [Candidatus Neomarinimicrobiota bacterium]MBT3944190.1 rhodanese-like domain-containing protein [Candidatus Neomarinimicrobiota bacterium]MBT4111591.1 rhodanese-like domain-containing protein [Candidatus Neomarinimicrobiota bacterium]